MTAPDNSNGAVSRPGISEDGLRTHGICHVGEREAEILTGYRRSGIAIPYYTANGEPLLVNNDHFHRLRPDESPKNGAKYLSPREGGCQLYIPLGQTFSDAKELVIAESEFKALCLALRGTHAVGLGGFSSGLPGGKLLPALEELLLSMHQLETVYFLGDNDTCTNSEFAREAVKLAKALPKGCALKVPRIGVDLPKGIDDVADHLGDGFADFWEGAKTKALKVSPKMNPDSLSVALLAPELSKLKELPDWQADHYHRITALSSHLGPVALDALAKEVKATFGISTEAFEKEAVRKRVERETPENEGPLLDLNIYFDGQRYFRCCPTGYESLGREDMMLHLRSIGFLHRLAAFSELSPCEVVLNRIQTSNRIDYAGPFCGRPAGIYRENGLVVLATQSPTIIEPKEGDATPLLNFFTSLFGHGGDPCFSRQMATFILWLRQARLALKHPHLSLPGQALGLVGEPDCGKSLTQSIISMALGGREADPSSVLVKGSDFNSSLWQAEHLRLGDEELVEDARGGTRLIRERIKKLVTADVYPLHAKYRDARNLRPIWRVSLSGNDDSESIAFFPPPIDSFRDKIIYLFCHPPKSPYSDGTPEGKKVFFERLCQSLPAFLHIVNTMEPPPDLQSSRFGVIEFHHPKVVELINRASPVAILGEHLLSFIARNGGTPIEGSATELYKYLSEDDPHMLRSVSKSPAHFGHQLARLAKLIGWKEMISRGTRWGKSGNEQTIWKIAPSAP